MKVDLLLSEEGRKCHVAVHPVPCDAHSFSHGESGGYRTNAKSFDMSKTDSGKKGSDSQTNDVKADLDLRVGDGSDLDSSLGKRSVGDCIWQRLESAIPMQISM